VIVLITLTLIRDHRAAGADALLVARERIVALGTMIIAAHRVRIVGDYRHRARPSPAACRDRMAVAGGVLWTCPRFPLM
jgi:hypothetical protein